MGEVLYGCTVSDASQYNIENNSFYSGRSIKYCVNLSHKGLMKARLITSTDQYVLNQKVASQIQVWEEMWKQKLQVMYAAQKKQSIAMDKERSKQRAIDETKKAQDAITDIKNTLQKTLSVNDAINWDTLKDNTPFSIKVPGKPKYEVVPNEPKSTDSQFIPELSFADKIFKSKAERKINTAKALFESSHAAWEREKMRIESENTALDEKYNAAIEAWKKEKQRFIEEQKLKNEAIDNRQKQYLEKDSEAIVDYYDIVLSNSQYPDTFPKDFEMEYNPETKILIIDYLLPAIEDIPKVKEVKYIQSQDKLSESYISETELNKIYDDLIYQMALRTIHELFESDTVQALDSVVFNGWVKSIDKATGQVIKPCIVSVQAGKAEFLAIELSKVDAKACFKSLKGVGSSKLHSLAPIAPVLQISREDKRFISSYDVSNTISEGDNLAAMDWEDFEHLIRELFEKEFSQSGAEVKVTQASRDGGVDAVVFDPDPLRGGKIVIQAKRYTNTVSVSAVRDLYGTVVNEGAIKGILVSTADYGPDAYEFAKGKPLTLLNGSNLLHLLDKHGHKARIDLKEAKKIIMDAKI